MKRLFGVNAVVLSTLLWLVLSQHTGAALAIKLDPSDTRAATEKETADIKKLIDDLASIASPDFGLSATMSGTAFAPISGLEHPGAMLLTYHGLKTDPAFLQLVKLGPKALPFLLEALRDQKETGLTISHDEMSRTTGMGGMWYTHELWGNSANTNEQNTIGPKTNGFTHHATADLLSDYRVKVGDVCFVIIGQIVGRPYQAVRYQPTAIIVINSPTHDAELARQVRAIWSDPHPAQHLLDSLLLDYSSTDDGFKNGAATRLQYYFPHETAILIADKLAQLDVQQTVPLLNSTNSTEYLKGFEQRESKNGVRTDEFIKAVAWCDEPRVRTEMQKIFMRTSDPDLLLPSAISMKQFNPEAERKRLEEFISNRPESESGPFGEGYHLLVLLGQDAGASAKPAFIKYMQNASLQRCRSMCRVLLETQGQWSIELLAPLLDDKRSAEGWTYAINPDHNEPRLPIRICDEAAGTIARNFQKLSFKQVGQHADLDRQIKKMERQIASKDF